VAKRSYLAISEEALVKYVDACGSRRPGGWRAARLAAAAAGLGLVARALVAEAGSPLVLLRTLRDLGDAWADPVVSVLALMALAAETLVGYLLVVLVLRSLRMLPGSIGRVADRLTLLVTPSWSVACSTCSSAARCSPRRPWRRRRIRSFDRVP
jgi:hypothetical protein